MSFNVNNNNNKFRMEINLEVQTMDSSLGNSIWRPISICYEVSDEVVNRVAENLHVYGRFVEALYQQRQSKVQKEPKRPPPLPFLPLQRGPCPVREQD